jgi:hypothetical protein
MLRLTELIGTPVTWDDPGTADSPRASLADLVVRLGPGPHVPAATQSVERLLVRHRRGCTLVAWTAVDPATMGAARIRLTSAPGETGIEGLAADELLLVRDVLDTQIVDVVGHRVNRVGDVLLDRYDHHLRAVAVEVGASSVLRRLGLGRGAARPDAIDWQDLHLTSDRGHTVQLATTTAALHRLDPVELAELVARLPSDDAVEVLAAVPPERADAALEVSHPHVRRRLERIMATPEPAPARWHRLRGWDRHRGPRR